MVAAIGLLWFLPFVWTEHRFPLGSLDSELVAAICLGLALLCGGLVKRADLQIDWPLPALLGLLVSISYLQLGLSELTYPLQAHRFALYAAAMMVAYLLGRELVALQLVVEAVDAVALAVVAGGAFSGVVQWFQLFDLQWLPRSVAMVADDPAFRTRPFANVGQANHLATYLGWAALCVLYWQVRNRRAALSLTAFHAILASGLAMTGSRMGIGYVLVVLAALVVPTGLRPAAIRVRFLTALMTTAGYTAGVLAHRLLGSDMDALARLGTDSLPIRFELWRQALQMSFQHPLLGVGIGQFPAAQFWIAHDSPYTLPSNNCHNLVLQLAGEFGWPAALATAALALWWFCSQAKERLAAPHTALALGAMLVLGIHSLLEYPLWHLYFAIPAALMFAIAEPARRAYAKFDARRILGVSGLAVLGVALAFRSEYDPIARVAAPIWLDPAHISGTTANGLTVIADSQLFRPEVDRLLLQLRHPPDEKTDEPLKRTQRVMQSLPAPEVIALRVILLARDGRIEEAVQTARRLPVFARNTVGNSYALNRDWILDETRDLGPQTAPLRRALREMH
jgi:O-antigen ligase